MTHLESAAALARLSDAGQDPATLSRRRFLQLALAAGAASGVAAAGASLAAGAGPSTPAAAAAVPATLVVILLAGGNDGTNTLVPYADAAYAPRYGPLAVPPDQVLPIDGRVGLHPSLRRLKARYAAGTVAVVQGLGYVPTNLSHFQSLARWMAGTSAEVGRTGWVGRYLSTLGAPAALAGVYLGDAVPLHFQATTPVAVSLPVRATSVGFRSEAMTDRDYGLVGILGRFDDRASDRGAPYDRWNRTLGALTDLGVDAYSAYAASLPTDDLAAALTTAARLINLGAGVRVIGLQYGDFDTHALQYGRHADLLARLDAGIEAFFAAIDPAQRGRALVMTMSEFGRRPWRNSSDGTDHGGASVGIVVGDRVRGGLYGAPPSLTDVDVDGNLKASVDPRSLYATVLQDWLATDATPILGAAYPTLGFTKPQ